MLENELTDAIKRFFSILQSINLKAHITGGLASSYYGEPRYTQDIDIVVDPVQLNLEIQKFLGLLGSTYLYSEENIRNSLSSGRMFQIIDDRTGFKFDVYPREGVAGELSRSETVELFPSMNLPLLSLTDCVVSKLQWIKKGSNKSILDVKGIFGRLSDSEKETVFVSVRKIGLEELLNQVLSSNIREPE